MRMIHRKQTCHTIARHSRRRSRARTRLCSTRNSRQSPSVNASFIPPASASQHGVVDVANDKLFANETYFALVRVCYSAARTSLTAAQVKAASDTAVVVMDSAVNGAPTAPPYLRNGRHMCVLVHITLQQWSCVRARSCRTAWPSSALPMASTPPAHTHSPGAGSTPSHSPPHVQYIAAVWRARRSTRPQCCCQTPLLYSQTSP